MGSTVFSERVMQATLNQMANTLLTTPNLSPANQGTSKPMSTSQTTPSPFIPGTRWHEWFTQEITPSQRKGFTEGRTVGGNTITSARQRVPDQCIPEAEFEALLNPKPKVVVHFESVILADDKKQQILEALEQVHQSELIFDTWGFGETIEKGRGVSLLFYGPPGTGKTLMAQAIANELKTKLNIISTADVESNAPGEAERNIRKHFADAKKNKAVLLFDECDSLIYSRNGVGPIMAAQVNELLSQLERFEGVTIFTTNRLGTLDEAFNRRLALKLEFPMPTVEQRIKIWRRMFPEKAPLAKNIDWKKLATVEISGGYIKNAVLRAARMAAIERVDNDKKKIRMPHLVKALQYEALSMVEFERAQQEHDKKFRTIHDGGGIGQDIVRGRP